VNSVEKRQRLNGMEEIFLPPAEREARNRYIGG
jgi:hypothetical protein